MAIIRIHTGSDGKSHFQEIVPKFEPRATSPRLPS
jgi:hypothetical protein